MRSRNTQAKRASRKTAENRQLRRSCLALRREQFDAQWQLQQARLRIQRLEAENARLRQQPVCLPDDPPLAQHTYGAKLIALCVNLAQVVGLRAVEKVLQLFSDWLGVRIQIPDWTSVRTWLCRLGVASLEARVEAADDWIWMADHSSQTGPEKILVILGLRAQDMPPRGQPLRHADIRALAVVPGVSWKREDVAREYAALAERIGKPLAVLSDAASELRESTSVLQKPDKKLIQLGDFKHQAANVLKKVLDRDGRFDQFVSQLGRTRNAIQQTELAHLNPPPQKQKARFMNLAATFRWAEMVLWQLSHPQASAHTAIAADRFAEKLGWLEWFRGDVTRWNRIQSVISVAVSWINDQGVYVGAAEDLRGELSRTAPESCPASQQVASELVSLVAEAEQQLEGEMRLPLSTEVLESSFGRYKVLEQQHSKGGFTSLLAAFPALLRRWTAEAVRESFARVSVAALREWTRKHLGSTLAAKRKLAYEEFKLAGAVAK